MSLNPYDRHSDRLQTTDEKGNRVYIHPEDLSGRWKKRREILYWFLIGIFLTLPWIHINGKQSVLIDIANRKLDFFGLTFWGHDVPYLIFIILGSAFFFAFVTSIWGRVWCGWACPQTVFTEVLFRKVERLIEGKSKRRMELDQRKWDFDKVFRKSLKWFIFLIISLHLAHTFLGLFVGARKLLEISTHSPTENLGLFITMLVFTGLIMFDLGWFREQFCIIMCPYGRFQSVMMDSDSMVVAYDEKRGEPRKDYNHTKDHGDCVNCFQCVKVCPTGIDIRKGQQLECLACTACIDACDNIMDRLGKDRGLIRYTTENKLEGKSTKTIRLRTIIYSIILSLILIVSAYNFNHINDVDVIVLKSGRTPFTVKVEKEVKFVLNHYKVEFHYKGEQSKKVFFRLKNNPRKVQLITPMQPFIVKKGRKRTSHVFFKFPQSFLVNGAQVDELEFSFTNDFKNIFKTLEVSFVGPFK